MTAFYKTDIFVLIHLQSCEVVSYCLLTLSLLFAAPNWEACHHICQDFDCRQHKTCVCLSSLSSASSPLLHYYKFRLCHRLVDLIEWYLWSVGKKKRSREGNLVLSASVCPCPAMPRSGILSEFLSRANGPFAVYLDLQILSDDATGSSAAVCTVSYSD